MLILAVEVPEQDVCWAPGTVRQERRLYHDVPGAQTGVLLKQLHQGGANVVVELGSQAPNGASGYMVCHCEVRVVRGVVPDRGYGASMCICLYVQKPLAVS